MRTPSNPWTLAAWRRSVAELYAATRAAAGSDPSAASRLFRAGRDGLVRNHPQSPLAWARDGGFAGLAYYPYDPAWRITGRLDTMVERYPLEIDLEEDGLLRCTRVAVVSFSAAGRDCALSVFWIEGYGGGLWVPFADATSGGASYGGGRYLYDTIKGADLGGGTDPGGAADMEAATLLLDFNFAYNPSCAYDPRWTCPLAPPENRLPVAVTAGERAYIGPEPAARSPAK